MKTQHFALFTATVLLVLGSNYLIVDGNEGQPGSHLISSAPLTQSPVSSLFAMVYAVGITNLAGQHPDLLAEIDSEPNSRTPGDQSQRLRSGAAPNNVWV